MNCVYRNFRVPFLMRQHLWHIGAEWCWCSVRQWLWKFEYWELNLYTISTGHNLLKTTRSLLLLGEIFIWYLCRLFEFHRFIVCNISLPLSNTTINQRRKCWEENIEVIFIGCLLDYYYQRSYLTPMLRVFVLAT